MKIDVNKIGYLCDKCIKHFYPIHILKSGRLVGITMHMGKCPLCGKKGSYLTPLSDLHYAMGDDSLWD